MLEIKGAHAILAQLETDYSKITSILVNPKFVSKYARILSIAKQNNISINYSEKLKTTHEANIVAKSKSLIGSSNYLDDLAKLDKSIVLMLDMVTDPQNLGNLLRSSAVFGVNAIITLKKHGAKLSPVSVKIASGGASVTPVIPVSNLSSEIKKLQELGYWIYGAQMQAGTSCFATQYAKKSVIVLGSEGSGLRELTKTNCDEFVHIPCANSPIVSSLNVAMAGNIILASAYNNLFG